MSRPILAATVLLALAFPALPASAADVIAAALCGNWEHRGDASGPTLKLTLNADGSGKLGSDAIRCVSGDDLLDIELDGEWTSYKFTLAGNVLTLSGGELQAPLRFTRVSAAPGSGAGTRPGNAAPKPAPAAPGIHGKWRDANGAIIEFRPDGTGANRRGTFKYSAQDGMLVYNDGATVVLFSYRLEAERLVVESQGQSATFTRAHASASVTPRPGSSPVAPGSAAPARRVVVNGTPLAEAEITRLEQTFRVRAIPGEYWYDGACGAWGGQGGPAVGFLPAGLQLGGSLKPDASGGGTSVFVNGRELHAYDVAALQRITIVQPGRYWVDAMGNCGYEGNPTPLVNLVQLANAANARSGGSYHSRNDFTGIGSGGDGKTSYVMGKDWSVIIGE